MPTPLPNADGLLPPGVHSCNWEEIKRRYGAFRLSDRRPRLFNKLADLLVRLRASQLFVAVVVDGSFATEQAEPNDIDLVLVLRRDHDWQREPSPDDYRLLDRSSLRRHFGFDAFMATDGSPAYQGMVEFFSRVRDNPEARKGMLRVEL